MSDDFDKEAEREKLREKYEKDKQEREATEQMSELLLQGATMTNSHCSECGDPIFRYDGQEFCPTCEKPIDSQPENGEDAGETDDDSIQVRSPSDEAQVKFGSAGADEPQEQPDTQQAEQSQDQHQQTPDQRAGHTEPQQAPEPQQPPEAKQRPETRQAHSQPQKTPAATSGEGNLAAAEQSLVRTLTRFSQQAEATEDPRKAKEQLAAAREAAEALAALRQ
ncbi:Sjogren's syndrome/scleroderma autoantigen 1 family protein [Halobacteriaceae archaeon SHR40]|uniref:Sjogren's syndrome/scleroderma autoantigen 1 family protein n=1 Tax=Halovenus amylolytica TaxID=2500550 RepID=UPI000FE3BF9B